jgi:hypothetical protein
MALEVSCEPQRTQEPADHAGESDAARVGRRRSLEAVLRSDCARLGARASSR